MRRHDYLPYGEELYAGAGGRSSAQGYAWDGARRRFATYERDAETGLDYARARYYSASCGRFSSPDPYGGSMSAADPQTLNRYSYVANDPLGYADPSGMVASRPGSPQPGDLTVLSGTISNGMSGHQPVQPSATRSDQSVAAFVSRMVASSVGSFAEYFGPPASNVAPQNASAEVTSGYGQQLTPCLRNELRPFFPAVEVNDKKYSPVDDARFKTGIPWLLKTAAPGISAVTYGLFDIHYDPKRVDIQGGTIADLETVIEETAHAEQFLNMWSKLPMKVDYQAAHTIWAQNYLGIAARDFGYDNSIESAAKFKTQEVILKLKESAGRQNHGTSICGFGLFR